MNFIENAKGLTKNPLGIIALFISLIYGFACLVLSTSISNLKEPTERLPLIWFIIGFPIIILIGFIFLVTKHHPKLYSPSDYGNAESFLKTIDGSKKFESIEVIATKNEQSEFTKPYSLVQKVEDINLNKGPFSDTTKKNLQLANSFFDKFLDLINKKPFRNQLTELSFGAEAPEYFILSCRVKIPESDEKRPMASENVIIRVTRDEDGDLKLIGLGKDIIETDAQTFAERVVTHVEKFVTNAMKQK